MQETPRSRVTQTRTEPLEAAATRSAAAAVRAALESGVLSDEEVMEALGLATEDEQSTPATYEFSGSTPAFIGLLAAIVAVVAIVFGC